MPELKLQPDRIVRVPLSYLLSAAIFLVSISVAYGSWKSNATIQSQDLAQAHTEINSLHKDINDLRVELESVRVTLLDLKSSLDNH